ncbi:MAG: twin-arginine translocase subunit TatC [Bacteroidetes bacterium]|nr:MAG: twin-arginine translocase subunit TatC [Bacteroidota bacterium]
MPLDQVSNDDIDKYEFKTESEEKNPEDELKGSEMSLIDHLETLRWHLIRATIAVGVLMIVAFFNIKWIFENILIAPAKTNFWTYQQLCALGEYLGTKEALCIQKISFELQSRTMTGQFMMSITASAMIGLIIGFPYIFWEIWQFVKPALYKKEQKAASGAVFWVSMLFLLGVVFGYYVVTPLSINFLANYQIADSIKNQFDIVSYLSTVITLVIGCAFLFQLPILVYFLAKIGVITASFMRKYRRHAIVVILILAGVITPPDVFSQIIVSLPLWVLYEISINIALSVEKNIAKEEEK